MDPARYPTSGARNDVSREVKQARRATWAPTARTRKLASLDDAGDPASGRSSSTTSLTRRPAVSRPHPNRLSSYSEEDLADRTGSHRGYFTAHRKSVGSMDKRRSLGGVAPASSLRCPSHMPVVKRWDPRTRSTTPWDSLERDPELFYPAGELLVHLHQRGAFRRAPSFCVSVNRIIKMRCGPMFTLCAAEETADSQARKMPGAPKIYEIWIPGPVGASRDRTYNWHLTTRNFFAVMTGQPLVAAHLGKALVELQERLYLFRSEDEVDNQGDLLRYLNRAGYLKFGRNPDYALALLYFAEHYQVREIWIDAFAHCVGMTHLLGLSTEAEHISHTTQYLIKTAYGELNKHLDRCSMSMSNFLEEEISRAHLGFSSGALAHLERFRAFLHQFYLEKFGYWPPSRDTQFPRDRYKAMYFDFIDLYHYLADTSSTDSSRPQKPASGGICVLQNLQAFDMRHKYEPLQYSQPLVPESVSTTKLQSQRAILALTRGSRLSKSVRQDSARGALQIATNSTDPKVISSPLVRAYRQFERDRGDVRKEDKVSLADARKVRWILIYSILQTLIAITRAPPEVRDTESAGYPLCVLVEDLPPWECDGLEDPTSPISPLLSPFPEARRLPSVRSPQRFDPNGLPTPPRKETAATSFDIRPDCETDLDYFGRSHNVSSQSLASSPRATEMATSTSTLPLLRRNSSSFSQKSLKALSLASLVSRRNSFVKTPQPAQPAHKPIIIGLYGNGLNDVKGNKSSGHAPPAAVELASAPQPAELPASFPEPCVSTPPSKPFSSRSSNGSTTTIIAPQPLRPMSAHERRSFTLPADSAPADARGSTVPHHTPVSCGESTDSEHDNISPVWSSRRCSASSQSSAEMSPNKFEEAKLPPKRIEATQASALKRQDSVADHDAAFVGVNALPNNEALHTCQEYSETPAVVKRISSGAAKLSVSPTTGAKRHSRSEAFAAAQMRWQSLKARYND